MHVAPRCESVIAIDSSSNAVSRARSNAAANGIANIHFREGDVFDFLTAEQHGHQTFSTIVLDPPPSPSRDRAWKAPRAVTRRSTSVR